MEVEEMRAECVRHYVKRRNSPEQAEVIVPKDEAEIRRIYECIQEGKERGYAPPSNPLGIQFEQDDNT